MNPKSTHVEQFVMAYEIEQDRMRALLPEGFRSLRPVLRINTEIYDEKEVYVEFNTPVEAKGRRGWLNIANWSSTKDNLSFVRSNGCVRITAPFLELSYKGIGMEGGCPAEKDNEGCYFRKENHSDLEFRPVETIQSNKEFCDCEFAWKFHDQDASGKSEGKTIPAYEEKVSTNYPKEALTAERAAAIPCKRVLGSYIVRFER